MDEVTGDVTLLESYYTEVMIKATVKAEGNQPKVTSSISFFANLQPALGDIDLGATSGAPLPAIIEGESVEVDVRLNAQIDASFGVYFCMVIRSNFPMYARLVCE